MSKLQIFLSYLYFIVNPSWWLMNQRYDKYHDAAINKLMDKYKFTSDNDFTAFLGETQIWIGNYPHAIGINDLLYHSRPSRLTILRIGKAIKQEKANRMNEYISKLNLN